MAESSYDSTGSNEAPPSKAAGLTPRYRFTPEEIRCLKECNRESFYYRSLPIATAFSTGTYYAVRYGYLTANTRFGAAPKMLFAALTGYFIGKFSYQQKCIEKIMQLPNSPLADMLRKQKAQRGGAGGFAGFTETLSLEPGFTSASGITSGPSMSSDDSYSVSSQFSDVSDTRPLADSYDTSEFSGSYRENELQMTEDTLPPKPPQFTTTYDELRRQNREDFDRKHHASSLQGISDHPPRRERGSSSTSSPPNSQWSQFPTGNPENTKPNVYGDMWDEKSQ